MGCGKWKTSIFEDMFNYGDFVCCDCQDVVLDLVVRHWRSMATTGLAMIFQSRCSVRTSLCSFLLGLFGTNLKGNWEFRGGELSRYLALVPASLELHRFAQMLPWSVKQKETSYLQIWDRYKEHYANERIFVNFSFSFLGIVSDIDVRCISWSLKGNSWLVQQYRIELYVV
jgi:hypothetical protein